MSAVWGLGVRTVGSLQHPRTRQALKGAAWGAIGLTVPDTCAFPWEVHPSTDCGFLLGGSWLLRWDAQLQGGLGWEKSPHTQLRRFRKTHIPGFEEGASDTSTLEP